MAKVGLSSAMLCSLVYSLTFSLNVNLPEKGSNIHKSKGSMNYSFMSVNVGTAENDRRGERKSLSFLPLSLSC